MKIKFKITDKGIQLATVLILLFSLLISIFGNLEQIRQNKVAFYQQEEYTLLSKYRKDFILCSEHFMSLLGRAIDNDEIELNRELFFNDLTLSEGLISDEYIISDYLKGYPDFNKERIQKNSLIMRFTLGVASSYLKPSKKYPESFTISSQDLLKSINEANYILFKTKPNFSLKKYYDTYGQEISKSREDFYELLIVQFKH